VHRRRVWLQFVGRLVDKHFFLFFCACLGAAVWLQFVGRVIDKHGTRRMVVLGAPNKK